MATAKEIINDVAIECGLGDTSDPYSSPDQNFILLRTLLKAATSEFLRIHDWPKLRVSATFTVAPADDTLFDPPAGFYRFVNGTMRNVTQQRGLGNPLNEREWAILDLSGATSSLYNQWRWHGGQIQFYVRPTDGDTFAYEYLSKYAWGTAEVPANSSSEWALDAHALSRLLKLKFLQAKGLPDMGAQAEYRDALEMAKGEAPAGVVPLAHVPLAPTLIGGNPLQGDAIFDTGEGLY